MSDDVGSLADCFREEYALAAADAASRLGSEGWEDVWARVARQAAADLLLPDADVFRILRRLERLID